MASLLDVASRELRSLYFSRRGGVTVRFDEVISLINERGADPNVRDPHSNMTLIECVYIYVTARRIQNSRALFDLFLNNPRIRFDTYDSEGFTFLHKIGFPVTLNLFFLVHCLEDPFGKVRDAINLRQMQTGQTMLFCICAHRMNLREKISLLLEKGADPNINCNLNMSPLQRVLQLHKNVCVKNEVQILVVAGSDVNHRDYRGNTPLHYAVLYSHGTETLEYLLSIDHLKIKEKNNDGETPLDLAKFKNKTVDIHLIEAEITKRIRVRQYCELALASTRSLLDDASQELRNLFFCKRETPIRIEEIISVINERGADPNVTDPQTNMTVLESLYMNGQEVKFKGFKPFFKLFLSNPRIRFDIYNIEGSTFLHQLGFRSNLFFLVHCLEDPFGKVRDAINLRQMRTGQTMLYLICAHPLIDLREKILLLLEKGSDPNINCNLNMSPLQKVLESHRDICVRNEVQVLVVAGSDVNHRDYRGNTPLHYAVLHSNGTETLEYLLSIDHMQINKKNNDGETPLDLAKFKNQTVDIDMIEAEIRRRIRMRQDRELALMQSAHSRLGQNSILKGLDGNLLDLNVLTHLRNDDDL